GKAIPVIFHNWKNYDGKILIKAFAKEDINVKPIVLNSENFKTVNIEWGEILNKYNAKSRATEEKIIPIKVQFVDSFAHMSTSLDKLCGYCNPNNVPKGEKKPDKCEREVGMELRRQKCIITRPVYVGIKILELSKALMGTIWYTFKHYFGSRIQLILTDTDSFIVQLQTNDINKEFFQQFHDILDFSNCAFQGTPMDKHIDLKRNKKVLGKMKNEVPPYCFETKDSGESEYKHITIHEIEALRSKCYSIKLNHHAFNDATPFLEEHTNIFEQKDPMKNKGVTKTSRDNITHQDYSNVRWYKLNSIWIQGTRICESQDFRSSTTHNMCC
ncbi:hypothetical protein TCAL_10655, partial [Tigriopus californicus]